MPEARGRARRARRLSAGQRTLRGSTTSRSAAATGMASGFAQAVGAQAFARAQRSSPTTRSARRRRAPYHAIPRRLLTRGRRRPLDQALLVRLARRPERAVQTVVSLQSYAGVIEDSAVPRSRSGRAARRRDARALRHRYWSLYALPADWSPVAYQEYVIGLLKRLGQADRASPRPRPGSGATTISRRRSSSPTGGLGSLKFWLSKPASVTRRARPARRSVSRGQAAGTRSGGRCRRGPASRQVHVGALDWAGNSA